MFSMQNWYKYKKSRGFRKRIQKNRAIFETNQIFNNKKKLDCSRNHDIETHTEKQNISNISGIFDVETSSNWEIELTSEEDCEEVEESTNTRTSESTTELNIRMELQMWAVENNVSMHTTGKLLKILQKYVPLGELPVDPRTLIRTPSVVDLLQIGNGSYWHHGLVVCLEHYFSRNLTKSINISLNINIDGLPISKSSSAQFWPILFNIQEIPHFKPMVIGIYYGTSKPTSLEQYLNLFVNEMQEVLNEGLIINKNKINVRIRCFICDSPARSFIKGVTYFNGKHGCLKCTVVGEYISNRTVFLHSNCAKRTDIGFRNRIYGNHHKHISPIENLPLDMVEDFPIGDSLHLIDLGIMKRLLTGWTFGHFKGTGMRFSAKDINLITSKLLAIKLPKEFHRVSRGLDSLSFWKGTEYHTFLCYLGIVILKDFLHYDAYQHFLVFFCAITICYTDKYRFLLPLSRELLTHFIEKYIEIYKKESITSNVHNLCHLVDEVERLGNLNTFNSYPFENLLQSIKSLLRTGSRPLEQVSRRIIERRNAEHYKEPEFKTRGILKKQTSDKTFNCLEFEDYTLNIEMQNKWFLTKCKVIASFKTAYQYNNEICIKGVPLRKIEKFFENPIQSTRLDIYYSDLQENNEKIYKASDILCKMVPVPYKCDGIVFIPLIHTL